MMTEVPLYAIGSDNRYSEVGKANVIQEEHGGQLSVLMSASIQDPAFAEMLKANGINGMSIGPIPGVPRADPNAAKLF